jgi:hypothetical protein
MVVIDGRHGVARRRGAQVKRDAACGATPALRIEHGEITIAGELVKA